MNILIILAELSLAIFILFVLDWLAGKVFKQLAKVYFLKKGDKRTKTLRRTVRRILIVSCAVLCLLLAGANGVLIYQGEDIQQYTLQLIRRIPPAFWVTLATGIAKSTGILIAAALALRSLNRLLDVACQRVKKFEQLTATDESVEAFFRFLNKSLSNSIWLLSANWCAGALGLPAAVPQYLYIILRIYLIVAFGLLVLKANATIIDSVDALRKKYSSSDDNLLRFYDSLSNLIPLLKRCLEYVIYVSMATLALQQVDLIAKLADYGPKIIKIVGIIFLSGVLVELIYLGVQQALLNNKDLTDLQRQRRLTLIPLIESFLRYLLYFSGGVAILKTIDIDPTPILAGAGIVGLAVGFGAQNLINDMVCGFFILFENYYLVGDWIEIGEAIGTVEAIDLRTTRIRHPNGQQYIIRNGQIGNIVNYSKKYVYAVVEIGVAYDSNLDRVYEVLEDVGKQLKQRDKDVLEPTLVDGLEKFGESELSVRTITKVKPGSHLRIQRLLRKTIKEAFDRQGIEIPFPRRVLIVKKEKHRARSD